MDAMVTGERSQKEWLYLLQQFGAGPLRQAVEDMSGNRKPLLSINARFLGFSLPHSNDLPKLKQTLMTGAECKIGPSDIKKMLDQLGRIQESCGED